MRIADAKSKTLNLRISPSFTLTLKEAVDHGQRSIVNMLEVLLGEYCDRKGIALTPQKVPAAPAHKRARAERMAPAGAAA